MKYTATAVVTFGAGAVLGLNESQAAARKSFITPVPGKKGMYTLNASTQFKIGEQFIYDGDLPKSLADCVEKKTKPAAKPAEGQQAGANGGVQTSAQAGGNGDANTTGGAGQGAQG